VATFHLANGARLEQIFAFGNLRPYGIDASFGATASYRYLPAELEENHERFIRKGEIRVSDALFREHRKWRQSGRRRANPRNAPSRAKLVPARSFRIVEQGFRRSAACCARCGVTKAQPQA
jgi:hypothetical protein